MPAPEEKIIRVHDEDGHLIASGYQWLEERPVQNEVLGVLLAVGLLAIIAGFTFTALPPSFGVGQAGTLALVAGFVCLWIVSYRKL